MERYRRVGRQVARRLTRAILQYRFKTAFQLRRFLMNSRNTVIVLGVLSLVFVAVGGPRRPPTSPTSAQMTGSSYYSAYPTGVNSSGAVSMQGLAPRTHRPITTPTSTPAVRRGR